MKMNVYRTAVLVLAAGGFAVISGCQSAPHQGRAPAAAAAPTRSSEDEALRAALLDLKQRDQAARAAMIELMQSATPNEGGGFQISTEDYKIMQAVQEIDAESTAFLKSMVAERGWPTISEIGEEGAGAAWLLVQHADTDPVFQEQVLGLMEPLVDAGEAKGAHFALLTDRVLLAKGEKQVYATQFETSPDGKVMRPRATVDWENVETRRAAVGLPTLEVYAESMLETYGGTVELVPAEMVSGDED
jgi:hypothetical protein